MKPIITLSIGGSMLIPAMPAGPRPDFGYIRALGKMLVRLSSKYKFAIVTGGGAAARIYSNSIRELSGNEFMADQVAILTTWQNAYLLLSVLEGKAYKALPKTFDEAAQAFESNDIVVMGGTQPGITTDTGAVLLGERVGSRRLVNVSNVDAIYTADPRKDSAARKIPRMTHSELVMMAAQSDTRKAGENFVFDMLACKLLSRARMEAHFVSGKNLKDLENAIQGKKHSGTVVVPDK